MSNYGSILNALDIADILNKQDRKDLADRIRLDAANLVTAELLLAYRVVDLKHRNLEALKAKMSDPSLVSDAFAEFFGVSLQAISQSINDPALRTFLVDKDAHAKTARLLAIAAEALFNNCATTTIDPVPFFSAAAAASASYSAFKAGRDLNGDDEKTEVAP